ncbi:hypothetical protein FQU76_28420 [Streptomyces qinzhouensis]|uniref:Uncharacterized protein n=1 Tax=Streptomyces qinzhouensis TaxID=2599401 RepID=A0A5B8JIU2_9ACTN|nr:hypothetical protein FQU76_28420 [Streptomyces qinzhouensis]
MVTMATRDGGSIAVTRVGDEMDFHVRDREGRTVATVTRGAREGARLLALARLVVARRTPLPVS